MVSESGRPKPERAVDSMKEALHDVATPAEESLAAFVGGLR